MSSARSDAAVASVAIVGMAGRFPGSSTIDGFWHNLREGVESISFFSQDESRRAGVSPELIRDPGYVPAKGFLDDAELFDPDFFGINPREAEVIDPQQRVFLECAWEALEAAGYVPESFDGSIGVYAGIGMNTYLISNLLGNRAVFDAMGAYQVMLASDKDFLTTRVSYKLNLKGPSIVIQTACSTSLVAVHAAYQALLGFQCDMALAGGVTVKYPRKTGYLYQEGMIMSPDGHCRAFDARAKGTVGGEGVGIVVLKRLEDALEAGDRILAVIRGAAVNNDGSAKVGFSAPSVEGQAEVIAMAQSLAGVSPDSIGYIEAHGTGTALGDPVEVAALTRAFRMGTSRKGFCALGSVKTNIGHLDSAAGIAGLIKAVLMLMHREIPPSLHFGSPNPQIDFADTPFYVGTTLTDWKEGPTPRRAGVSSFGMGGTNAHVVLEEAPPRGIADSRRNRFVLPLSARTPEALEAATDNLVAHLGRDADLCLADSAYTLQVGRRHFPERRVVVCEDRLEGARLLETRDGKRVFSARCDLEKRPVTFLLTGQGAQHVGMAREIYEREPVFRQHFDRCADALKPLLGVDLRQVVYTDGRPADDAQERLRQTGLAQPALFATEYSLAMLWMSWGVCPEALLGHSLGEYVAACLAGVFTFDDALKIVAERARLMQSLPPGAMLAVPMDREALRPMLDEGLSLAAVNAPMLCVASGPADAIGALETRLSRDGVQARRLQTSHAFHSPMMDPIVEKFVATVGTFPLRPPSLPVLSNLTGTWLTPAEATDPAYWGRHLRNTVLFSDAVAELLSKPGRALLEVGPGQTLISLARQQASLPGNHVLLSSLPHPRDTGGDSRWLYTTLGRLWLAGVAIDWQAVHAGEHRRRATLPCYPFQRERYYVEPQAAVPGGDAPAGRNAMNKNPDLSRWFYVPSWRRAAAPGPPPRDLAEDDSRSWVVFADALGVGDALAGRLRAAGGAVAVVRSGRTFARSGDDDYTVDPGERASYESLFEDLAARDRLPTRLVHLFCLTGEYSPMADAARSAALRDLGFFSLIFSAQAILRLRPGQRLHVDVVSDYTQDVTGNEAVDADKVSFFGPCLVMPQEFGNLSCRTVDVVVSSSRPGDDVGFVSRLLAEIAAEPEYPSLAVRDGQRWVRHFEPVRLSPGGASSRLRDGGVYLITGGLGNIGLLLARHIAGVVRARLVLTGRSGLPPRADWAVIPERNPDLTRKIDAVREIERLGSEVHVFRADVADEEEMRSVLRAIDESLGGLNGVIHAAGLAGADTFLGVMEMDRALCERQFLPKVTGVRVLEQALRERALDFCVLTSSLSTVLGGRGFAAYAAANAFLDAFTHERNRAGGTPWITIDWDGLAPSDETGRPGPGQLVMSSEELVETFARVIGAESPNHVVVSTGDLRARLDLWVRGTGLPEAQVPKERARTALHARPKVSTAFAAPASPVEKAIATIWQDLLGVNDVGVKDDFFELGGHSLLAIQLLSKIRSVLGVELPIRTLFEARTVESLSQVVDSRRWLAESAAADGDKRDGPQREELEL